VLLGACRRGGGKKDGCGKRSRRGAVHVHRTQYDTPPRR
jgi:hypothetical protein